MELYENLIFCLDENMTGQLYKFVYAEIMYQFLYAEVMCMLKLLLNIKKD